MSAFTPAEIAYLQSQRLGRLATINAAGELHVVPVGFHYNPEYDTIDVTGHGMGQSRKFRDAERYGRAAFVVDDVAPPRQIRGIEVRGEAQTLAESGEDTTPNPDTALIRIKPTRIVAWGIDSEGYHPNNRAVG